MASGNIEDEETLLVQSTLTGKNDGVRRFQGSNDPVSGTRWNIVSTSWLLRWKRFKGLEPCETAEAPGPIDNSDIVVSAGDFYTSLSREDYRNVVVSPGLSVNLDYVLLSVKAWGLLSRLYTVAGPAIVRYSIATGETTSDIEILLKPVLVTIIPKRDKDLVLPAPKIIYVSRRDDQNRLKERLVDVYNQQMSTGGSKASILYSALWKLDPDINLSDLAAQLASSTVPIPCPGQPLPKDTTIEACAIAADEVVVLELWDKSTECRFVHPCPPKSLKCGFCNKKLENGYEYCTCAQNCYCSATCLRKDRQFHDCSGTKTRTIQSYAKSYSLIIPSVPSIPHSSAHPPEVSRVYALSAGSMRGLVGLQNLGNSCYMNSGLQCLLHTQPLVSYFLADGHLADLNRENRIGARGELAEALGVLFKEVWFANSARFAPWDFKRTLGKYLSQFEGYIQHDSHEFLTFTLDLVHEDVNRVRVKPQPRELDTEEVQEEALREMCWGRHKERNDSKIVDLMHGLYRSDIECPNCSAHSLIFDPFLTLSVSLPSSRPLFREVYFSPIDSTQIPVRLKLRLPPLSSIRDFKSALSAFLSKPESSLLIGLLNGPALLSLPADDHIITTDDQLIGYETFAGPDSPYVFVNVVRQNYGKPESLTRLLPLCPPASNRELYEAAYITIAQITRRDSEFNFARDFPAQGGNLFSLRVLCGAAAPCLQCQNPQCQGCLVEYNSLAALEVYMATRPPGIPLVVEAVFESRHSDSLKNIKEPLTDPSWDHPFSPESSSLELTDCLESTFSREQLDPGNSIFCRRCEGHVQAFRRLSVARLPEVLVLHLKRFRHGQGVREKDRRKVGFPLKNLNMGPYLHPRDFRPALYDLYAVSYHYGDLSSGHYTAASRLPTGEWYSFNDSQVRLLKPEDVIEDAAYLLFYQLRQD